MRTRTTIFAGIAVVAVIVALVVLVVWIWAPQPRPGLIDAAIDPRYPDLSMAPLGVQGIAVAEDGAWRLRFSATIINVGEAPFMASAYRRAPVGGWQVLQQIVEADGRYTEQVTPASLGWGGDGHDHWHVRAVETHWIETMDGQEIGRVLKEGYCFFDNTDLDLTLQNTPDAPQFSGADCGNQWDTSLVMGLSVGWGDLYAWHMFEQQIDVTGIQDGRYRLRAAADPSDWFDETDETNNETWTILDISRDTTGFPLVEVVEEAPILDP